MGHRVEPSGAAPRRSVPLGDWRRAAAPEPPAPGHPDAAPPGRLVVVSNRVPLPTRDGSSSAGGLAVALEGALKQRGGLWFGWSGKTADRPGQAPQIVEADNVTFAVLDVLKKDFDLFYAGFANRALWPICHYRLDLLQIDRNETEGYFRVNRIFAEALAPLCAPTTRSGSTTTTSSRWRRSSAGWASKTASASSSTSRGRPPTSPARCRPMRG